MPDSVAPLLWQARPPLKHALERLADIAGAAIGQPGDDRARGKHLRIGRQHYVGHRATGREPGDVHTRAVDTVRTNRFLDHLADRERLAPVAPRIARYEPVEAGVRIVRGRLFREQQDETVAVRQRRPTRTEIVTRGR